MVRLNITENRADFFEQAPPPWRVDEDCSDELRVEIPPPSKQNLPAAFGRESYGFGDGDEGFPKEDAAAQAEEELREARQASSCSVGHEASRGAFRQIQRININIQTLHHSCMCCYVRFSVKGLTSTAARRKWRKTVCASG